MSMEPEPITPMTDEEAELFRFLRFGHLPERVSRSETVETVDAESPSEPPAADPESPYFH
jgi:hypothetical protein